MEAGSSCTNSECHDPTISCAPGCSDYVNGDGICQEACNNAACGFDAGDCEGDAGWANRFCHNSWIGDGVCDRACYQLNGDGGDCDNNNAVCASDGLDSRRSLEELPSTAVREMARLDPISGRALDRRTAPIDYSGLVSVYPPSKAKSPRLLF